MDAALQTRAQSSEAAQQNNKIGYYHSMTSDVALCHIVIPANGAIGNSRRVNARVAKAYSARDTLPDERESNMKLESSISFAIATATVQYSISIRRHCC